MERSYKIGQLVCFVDRQGVRHPALVKCWWAQWPAGYAAEHPDLPKNADLPDAVIEYHKGLHEGGEPSCNLVFVSSDGMRNDGCGRQTEIETSVVHRGQQAAHGLYWCWPDE